MEPSGSFVHGGRCFNLYVAMPLSNYKRMAGEK
jgi:hypothetical protein